MIRFFTFACVALQDFSAAIGAGSLCEDGPVFVIGAGISGLVAARSLQRFGCNVTVFEALDRLGGRTHTMDSGLFAGTEEGAHWIHAGTDNIPSSLLLKFVGVGQKRIGGDSAWEGSRTLLKIYNENQTSPLSRRLRDASFRIFLKSQGAVEKYFGDRYDWKDKTMSVSDAWKAALLHVNFTREDELFLRFHQRVLYEQDAGAGMPDLSASAEFEADYTDFYAGGVKAGWEKHGDGVPEGGYSEVVRRLAHGLDVRFNTPIDMVRISATGVELHAAHNRFTAAGAVVTSSIGALQGRRPRFEPELPAKKQAALGRLGMGNVAKIFIRLKPGADISKLGAYTTGRLTASDEILTYCIRDGFESANSSVLECFLGGNAAIRAENLGNTELRTRVINEMSPLLGENSVEHVSVTSWSTNPYIAGAWSFARVGSTAADFDTMAEPVGRLHFAGEGTCRMLYGNVHAAVVSGARAAHAMLGLDADTTRALAASAKWPFFDGRIRRLCTEPPAGLPVSRMAPKAQLKTGRASPISTSPASEHKVVFA